MDDNNIYREEYNPNLNNDNIFTSDIPDEQNEYKEVTDEQIQSKSDELLSLIQQQNQLLEEINSELKEQGVEETATTKQYNEELVEHILKGDLEDYLAKRVEEERKKEYGTLAELAQVIYSTMDKDYEAPEITNLEISGETKDLISKIQLKEEDYGSNSVWIKPFQTETWVKKEDIESMDPAFSRATLNNENMGQYISLQDLNVSLSEFYNANKKVTYTVQQQDGQVVKYKLSKSRMRALIEFLKGHSYLNLTTNKNDKENDVRNLKSYNMDTGKKASLGSLNLGPKYTEKKEFMTPGKYVSVEDVVEELPTIFKKKINWTNFEEDKKDYNFGQPANQDIIYADNSLAGIETNSNQTSPEEKEGGIRR